MVRSIWKLISVLLGLAAFLIIGIMSLINGEELWWSVLKAVGSFVVCMITFGTLGNMLISLVPEEDEKDQDSSSDTPKDKAA